MTKLTQMENKVYTYIAIEAYYDLGTDLNSIIKDTRISVKQVRGVLSSLTQKGLICFCEDGAVWMPLVGDYYSGFNTDHYDEGDYYNLVLGVASEAEAKELFAKI